ncbi:hypothetical protein A2U01_0007186 [Trifolium medium]|uniref:Uncharacterized protein n=1 Tax=Trifolium medium TaxID=97028 RepID=A0A392MG92_9FABA|nr:hypothetical protein [Trifolium medium]
MERKNTKVDTAKRSKSQKEKKKVEASTSRPRRTRKSKEVKVEVVILSSDTSDSDSTDSDYAEFLRTYDPQESYPNTSSTDEEDGTVTTVDSGEKPPESLKATSDSE